MKIRTQELSGPPLDWAVAKCDGMTQQEPKPMTEAEAEKMTVPFYLWGTTSNKDKHGNWSATVEKIKVVRYGVDKAVGATSPSISFIGDDKVECRGSVGMFFGSEEEAKSAVLYENSPYQWEEGGFQPSTDWAQGGPIIEREGISTNSDYNGAHTDPWVAETYSGGIQRAGPTPLIAAMRCYCASKLGDTVDVPEELCK